MDYMANDIEFGSALFLQVEAFDPPHIDETGKSIPRRYRKRHFWEKNADLSEPKQIGEAMSKYNKIYSIEWQPSRIGESYVWAKLLPQISDRV